MKEELISLNTAKLAKEKGFPQIPSQEDIGGTNFLMYYPDGHIRGFWFNPYDYAEETARAATQSLLQKWLREEHRMHIAVMPWSKTTWWYQVEGIEIYDDPNGVLLSDSCTESDTYEEALECGLLKSLGLIKY
jgi:hypothetical protein